MHELKKKEKKWNMLIRSSTHTNIPLVNEIRIGRIELLKIVNALLGFNDVSSFRERNERFEVFAPYKNKNKD